METKLELIKERDRYRQDGETLREPIQDIQYDHEQNIKLLKKELKDSHLNMINMRSENEQLQRNIDGLQRKMSEVKETSTVKKELVQQDLAFEEHVEQEFDLTIDDDGNHKLPEILKKYQFSRPR